MLTQPTVNRGDEQNLFTVTYINNMGGTKTLLCNSLARDIWNWCGDNNLWISAEHLPGTQNTIADKESRIFNDGTEWMLRPHLFERIVAHFGQHTLDLFASRLNTQLEKYVSWKPDPGALFVDAFARPWNSFFIYAFPPFSLLTVVGRRQIRRF